MKHQFLSQLFYIDAFLELQAQADLPSLPTSLLVTLCNVKLTIEECKTQSSSRAYYSDTTTFLREQILYFAL